MKDIAAEFKILSGTNLKLSVTKSEFNVKFLYFLDYNISADGIKPTTNKTSGLKSFL